MLGTAGSSEIVAVIGKEKVVKEETSVHISILKQNWMLIAENVTDVLHLNQEHIIVSFVVKIFVTFVLLKKHMT